MYERIRYIFRGSIEVEERHSGRYGAPGQPRKKKVKATPEQIEKQNQKNRENKTRRLIKANFFENDYWVTLTYRKGERPGSIQEAVDLARKALRKLKAHYRRMGLELKYIICTEVGSKGGIHHHVIINRAPDGDTLINEVWPHGHPDIKLLYRQGEYKALAEYITKQPEKAGCEKRYSRSRNLVVPEPEKRIMLRPTWNREPKPPKGYYLDKDTYIEGVNPVTGYKYRHYMFVRLNRRD